MIYTNRIRCLAVTTLVVFTLLPIQAMAMRCGTHIITRGDPQAKVLRYCGEPTQTSSRFITRASSYSDYRNRQRIGVAGNSGQHEFYFSEEVLVEDWIFNLGPNKLMRKVTFENGEVVKVDTLDYGYHE